ncbi:dynein axonemal intermediate chain 4 [Helicoverpa armigera]|uniref:dynein axonemal intermediate chain 4 n=1 Tax=Helicoverpa armigera TaxID=29058 RepID=UPI003082AA7F
MIAPAANPSSHSILSQTTKNVKLAPQALPKRLVYRVILNGVNATPEDINDPAFSTMEETSTHAAYVYKCYSKSETGLRSKSMTYGWTVYATTINLDDIKIDHTLDTEEGLVSENAELSKAPSAYIFSKMSDPSSYPSEITITLKETETIFLFSIPSICCDKDTSEGKAVEEENVRYEYITTGKGKNRKKLCQSTQTKETITQTRHTLAMRPQKKNAIVFASVWDMYDTYAKIAVTKEEHEEKDEMVMYQSAAPHLLRQKKKKVQEVDTTPGKTFLEIAQIPQYLDAVLLTDRVLASLKYGTSQKRFRGLISMDPLSLDLVYVYTLRALWTYECEETYNKPISSIAFNHKYPHICAISHGKFAYADECQGMVSVWCFKNPCKPERLYTFDVSVTSVGFSTKNPSWLACGFSNGDVIIIDIQSYTKKIIASSKRDTNPCFEPIWVVTWRSLENDNEYVMITCQDGRIRKLHTTKTYKFVSAPMMRISVVEGNVRGLVTTKTCLKVDVPITRYPAVLCMIWHPTIDHCYLVGTDEGCIHKCSTHYLNQHMDVFRAHEGPVNDICMSPFMNELLASCGADNAIRLWFEGLEDAIMTLNCQSAVTGITFCPINATILISASGQALSVWDLRRKIHMPCAEYTFPGNVTLTYVQFEASGHNVFVGDTLGRLHTFHLEDTPIPPYNQTKMLDEAIRKALCTRPHMIKQLDKLMRSKDLKSKSDK